MALVYQRRSVEARLWQRLPFELVERVLSFLPAPDLCRCRAVCKRWDYLISTPKFGALCLENARKTPSYIVVRVVEEAGSRYDSDSDESDSMLFADSSDGDSDLNPESAEAELKWERKTAELKKRREERELKQKKREEERLLQEQYTHFGWSILDVEAQRWYKIQHDHALGEEIDSCVDVGGWLAADGGLVCECRRLQGFLDLIISLTVFNPLTKTTEVLPHPPRHKMAKFKHALLDFAVDETDNSFRVFFIHQFLEISATRANPTISEDPEEICRQTVMHIYESNSGQWRPITNPPLPSGCIGVGMHGCSVMFQGVLYVLFSSFHATFEMLGKPRQYWLCSYDITEDVWEEVGVSIDNKMFDPPQLIVSDNRLFLLAWVNYVDELSGDYWASLRLREVSLAKKTLPMVFEMTSVMVLLIFNLEDRWTSQDHLCHEIQGYGYGKSVILMSRISGVSIVYDLEERQWSQLPTNPVQPLPKGCRLWFAANAMSLRLPSGRRKTLKIRKSKKKTWREACAKSRKVNGNRLLE